MAIQLNEFAKQVLFASTLEEKLSFPREAIIDTAPGDPIATPAKLSRPNHLRLRENGVRAKHPTQAKLVNESERGKLLHFFCNHELLATELMALALLKFPNAPKSFRIGLLDTLKDEQIHTRIYLRRMQQCGVEFGELPLSDYFWKSVSSMEDPLDYVTRLSLTFEQANLDYSREYGRIFGEMGDRLTAAILEKIYNDEIEHVGFGLKWFRKWKASGKSDWEAYRDRLAFPLSPARAKGQIYNAAGREAAGLDRSFINDLELYSRSRGRTPNVYWFNPDAERFAAANACDSFQATSSPIQEDLEFLMAYLAKKDDILIVSRIPSPAYLRELQSLGMQCPELIPLPKHDRSVQAPRIDRKLGGLRPWAWTPDSLRFFESCYANLTRNIDLDTIWNPETRELFSKTLSAKLGRELASPGTTNDENDWLAPQEVYGQVIRSAADLQQVRLRLKDQGYPNIVCKAPFGTAANAMRCLIGDDPASAEIQRWLDSTLEEQGEIVVEPWLDRVFDFSLQLEMRESRLILVGYTRLLNNRRGQFRGIIANAFAKALDERLVRFLLHTKKRRPRLYQYFETQVLPVLEARLSTVGYQGPLGIDAFVYQDSQANLHIKPIVELNPRVTMGRIALEASRLADSKSVSLFQILNREELKRQQLSSFSDYYEKHCQTDPARISSENGKLVSGTVALTEPNSAKRFAAFLHVRRQVEELPIR